MLNFNLFGYEFTRVSWKTLVFSPLKMDFLGSFSMRGYGNFVSIYTHGTSQMKVIGPKIKPLLLDFQGTLKKAKSHPLKNVFTQGCLNPLEH